jgi:hypothetical protein
MRMLRLSPAPITFDIIVTDNTAAPVIALVADITVLPPVAR